MAGTENSGPYCGSVGPALLGPVPGTVTSGPLVGRCGPAYLDLPEVHRLADQLVVLWQLLPGGQLDEHLAQLTPVGARGADRGEGLSTGPTNHRDFMMEW